MKPPTRRQAVFAGIGLAALSADVVTKAVVLRSLRLGVVTPVFGRLLQWALLYNPGSIFGLNPADRIPGFPTSHVLIGLTFAEMAVLIWFYRRSAWTGRSVALSGLTLILSGACGNVLDRVLCRPGVVDFILMDLGFPPFHPWPTFNVADIWITLGVALLLLDLIRVRLATPSRPPLSDA